MIILYIAHPTEEHGTEAGHVAGVLAGLRKAGHTVIDTSAQEEAGKPHSIHPQRFKLLRRLTKPLHGEIALAVLLWQEIILYQKCRTLYSDHNSIEPTGYNLSSDSCSKVNVRIKRKVDIVYSRHRWLNLPEILLRKKVPYVREINGFVADEQRITGFGNPFSRWLFDRIEHWNMKKADWWIPVCSEAKATMAKCYSVPEGRITVINNGANTKLFHPTWHTPGRQVCFVGALWVHQNLYNLLDAHALMKDAGMLIIGGGPQFEELKTAYPQAVFTGKVPQAEVAKLTAESGVCVGPLLDYSDPYAGKLGRSALKLYEYLACGVPVVCSRSVDSEFIERENLGLLINDIKPETIAQAVNFLLDRPELRKQMGTRARKWAVENTDWDTVAQRISAVMEEVICQRD